MTDFKKISKAGVIATTSSGHPLDSITASQTAGERGPILLQDFSLIDHIAAFDRERIPERVSESSHLDIYYLKCAVHVIHSY